MKRKVIYSIIIGACLIVIGAILYLPKHTWITFSMDGAGGGGFGASGKGLGTSLTKWKSRDGVMVVESVIAFSSAEDARKDFEEELKREGTIVEQDDERLVRVSGNPAIGEGAAEIIKLEGDAIRHIAADSLSHAITFESSWIKL